MINIKLEMNGIEHDINTRSATERTMIALLTQTAVNTVQSKLTEEEQSKISIIVKGESVDKLALQVSGPPDIISKLSAAMNATSA